MYELKFDRWVVKAGTLVMFIVSAGHLPAQDELAIYHGYCGRNGYWEGFKIDERETGKHTKSNYLRNNPELKSVPPSLSEFSCCPETFQDLWQESSCLNRGPHFGALHFVLLTSNCSDNKSRRNVPLSHRCPLKGCFGVWQDLHSWCCSSQRKLYLFLCLDLLYKEQPRCLFYCSPSLFHSAL